MTQKQPKPREKSPETWCQSARFESKFHHLIDVSYWPSYLTALCLSFLFSERSNTSTFLVSTSYKYLNYIKCISKFKGFRTKQYLPQMLHEQLLISFSLTLLCLCPSLHPTLEALLAGMICPSDWQDNYLEVSSNK